MANTKVTGDLIASGTITADNLVSGTLDALLNSYLTTNTYATQGYVTTAVNNLIAAAPASLDTLNELAAALNDDANFATTVTNSLATKLNLSGGTLTGNLDILNTSADTNLTIETTATGSDARLNLRGNSSGTSQIRFGDEDSVNVGLITYFHTDNSLVFRNNASESMRIDSSGRVGIGTNSPSELLEVAGTILIDTVSAVTNAGLEITTANNRNGRILFNDSDASSQGRLVYDHSTDSMQLYSAGSERLRIDSSGNVGIGTTSPEVALEIYKNASQGNPSNHTPANATLKIQDSSNQMYLDGNSIIQTGSASFTIGNTQASNILFYTDATERFRIDSSGNIGIGTTSPTSKLQVSGQALVGASTLPATGFWSQADNLIIGGETLSGMTIYTSSTSGNSVIAFADENTSGSAGFSSGGVIYYEHGTNSLVTRVNGDEAIRIINNRNVGIGVSSPGAKLDVAGGINCTSSLTTGGSITVSGTGYREIKVDQTDSAAIRMGVSSGSAEGFILVENTGDNHHSQTPAVKILSNSGTVSEYARFTSSGLTFNGDTAAANALDDYEEGTWGPILSWNQGGDYTMDNGTTIGRYTKIGNLVYVTCTIKWTAAPTGTSGNLVVRGLPFTIAGVRNAGCFSASVGGIYFSSSSYTQWTITGDPGRDDMYIIQQGSGIYNHRPTVSSSGTVYSISLTYRV